MKTAVEIPDNLYRELELQATADGTTVNQLIVDLVGRALQPSGSRISFPLITSKTTRKLRITNSDIDEILFG